MLRYKMIDLDRRYSRANVKLQCRNFVFDDRGTGIVVRTYTYVVGRTGL